MSGNCINSIDLKNYREIDSANSESLQTSDGIPKMVGEVDSEMHVKILTAERPITAYAIYSKENIIAYSERNSTSIKLVRWSPISGVITSLSQLEGFND